MAKYIEVVIDGKVYSIEHSDEEYARRLSAYLNNKYQEFSEAKGYTKRNNEYKNMMLQVNIADDYLRCKDENNRLKDIVNDYEHQIFNLKHELITLRLKNEDSEE